MLYTGVFHILARRLFQDEFRSIFFFTELGYRPKQTNQGKTKTSHIDRVDFTGHRRSTIKKIVL